jgi:hypothetical protein
MNLELAGRNVHWLDETGRNIHMRGALWQVVNVGLDGYVAASQPRNNGMYLVLEAEGRRPR